MRATPLLLLVATASCSVALDFGSFRFEGPDAAAPVTDLGAHADADGASTDDLGHDGGSPVEDAAVEDVTVDADPPADAGSPIDNPPAEDAAPDRPAIDRPSMDAPDVPPRTPRSCVEALAQGRTASALYAIDADGDPDTRAVTVYCDQEREGGGWLRVALMADGAPCPAPFVARASEGVCGRAEGPMGRVSVMPVAVPVPFREVRGRVALKARGDLDAFGNLATFQSWEDTFVDGVTVSRVLPADGATSRQHAFTWAVSESARPLAAASACPCRGGGAPLAAVGARYLCRELIDLTRDAGSVDAWREPQGPWLDPGAPCAPGDPDGWMRADLGATLRAPLELRLLLSGQTAPDAGSSEDIGIAALELYVR